MRVYSFYLGKYEVMQKKRFAVMGPNPSAEQDGRAPVKQVSYLDAVDFCNRLSAMEGLNPCYTIGGSALSCDFLSNGYRLPTGAEWQYAAKGGRLSRGSLGPLGPPLLHPHRPRNATHTRLPPPFQADDSSYRSWGRP